MIVLKWLFENPNELFRSMIIFIYKAGIIQCVSRVFPGTQTQIAV